MERHNLYINGQSIAPSSGEWFDSDNPYTGKPWVQIASANQEDLEKAVHAAEHAFLLGEWAEMTPTQRGKCLRKLGDLFALNAEAFAIVESTDNGKPIRETRTQMNYLPEWLYYFAGLADKIEGRVIPIDKADTACYTRYEPLGVVAAIIPWNSPLMITVWKIAPALAAGNTVIIKPSEYTSTSCLKLAALFTEAGFPPGVINVLTGEGAAIGQQLVSHPRIAKVSFTGGTDTGIAVNKAAAADLKHVSLELGGKSANIVFADANLDNAAKGVVAGIFAASGQTCIAGSRLLVERSIKAELLERVKTILAGATQGDPLDDATDIGPVANQAQFEKITAYFATAEEDGANCIVGGDKNHPLGGLFVQPTIYDDVTNTMRIAQEEVFGPLLAVISFDTEAEAIAIANDSRFGLAAAIWTSDIRRATALPAKLQAGTVWVNTYRSVSFAAPFGGYKFSGIGRESGQDAIQDYLQVKTVWLSYQQTLDNPFVVR